MNSNLPSRDDLYKALAGTNIPTHVAIIMDGNGRWAKKRLLNRIKGHEEGANTVRRMVEACGRIGIPYLTLYAFSTENWKRPKQEVRALMGLLKRFLKSETPKLVENDIRLNVIGQIERLPEGVKDHIRETMHKTSHGTKLCLNMALSYGSRDEIIRAVKSIAEEVQLSSLRPDEITSDIFANHLYTAGIPDPDILIRTSGEMRISNFLLWQIAYSELFITETLWPDFQEEEFVEILKTYQKRERRFGQVPNP